MYHQRTGHLSSESSRRYLYIVVSAIGFETFEEQITLKNEERTRQTIVLKTATHQLDEVVVVSNGVSRVQKSAFNAVALDTRELHNSTKSLSDALTQLPGLKLRESGGVGSDMQLMLDGFLGQACKNIHRRSTSGGCWYSIRHQQHTGKLCRTY